MILVDTRAGSDALIKPLAALGVPVEGTTLEYGDVAFTGKGAKGKPVDIGIEFKQLGELVGSIRDGRFAGHQLPGLTGERAMYDHAWLLIEWPETREDSQGYINVYRGRRAGWQRLILRSEFEKTLLTYALCGGIHVQHTDSRAHTLRWLVSLYRWWTDHALDGHTSHLAVHRATGLLALSPFRQAVTAWPGIGRKLSKSVESTFRRRGRPSLRAAVLASADDWANITTRDDKGTERRLGRPAAERLLEFFN